MTSHSNPLHGHNMPTGSGSIPSSSRLTAHSQRHGSALSTSESISKANKPRFRLSREGARILQETYDSGITNPDPEQKEELLDRIRAIRGNEEYTMKSLYIWFANKRAKSGPRSKAGTQIQPASTSPATSSKPTSSATPTDNSSKLPYLTPKNILTLHKLFYQSNTNPAQDLVDTWADLLSTETDAVTAWIEAEKMKLDSTANSIQGQVPGQHPRHPSASPMSLDPSRNILTPNSSTSPEPPPPLPSAFPSEPSTPLSPIAPRPFSRDAPAEPSHSTSTRSTFVKVEGEEKPFITPTLPPSKDPVRRDILLAIHEELFDPQHKHKQTPYPHPKTREELSALFSSCTRSMEEFLGKVKSGSLEKFGFKSDWA